MIHITQMMMIKTDANQLTPYGYIMELSSLSFYGLMNGVILPLFGIMHGVILPLILRLKAWRYPPSLWPM